ncbi:hypothetical protein SAMN05216338_100166 [Bradyrhizobium sp. Rc2d]|nr:hypothetical protein SAMN05216338_100166 [Bradyrhizobium sp. Rc2d]
MAVAVVGPPEVAEHLAVAVVRHQVPEGPPAVADPVEGEPVVKGRSRPVGAPKTRSQLAASIVQMKMTRRGDAIPIASDPPLEFRLQRDLSISACSLVYRAGDLPCLSALGRTTLLPFFASVSKRLPPNSQNLRVSEAG